MLLSIQNYLQNNAKVNGRIGYRQNHSCSVKALRCCKILEVLCNEEIQLWLHQSKIGRIATLYLVHCDTSKRKMKCF